MPLPNSLKAGVAAVTVSSPTLETTTLLIESDLQILVMSSRDEAQIFAENARTGKPWPGVRLLLSDGRSVFAEGKTGDDGFFRQRYPHPALKDTSSLGPKAEILCQWGSERYPESKDVECLRVFAAAEGGHVASAAVRLQGGPAARELADRITVDTDCAVYYAGETVHVSAAARHADGDRFVVEPGKKLTVEVWGGEDRRLRRQEVALSAAGAFAFDFPLPAEMPEGAFQVLVSDQAGHRQSAAFQVGRPQAETPHLVLDVPKTVYYRGETIEGTVRGVLLQDRPLAGVKLRTD